MEVDFQQQPVVVLLQSNVAIAASLCEIQPPKVAEVRVADRSFVLP